MSAKTKVLLVLGAAAAGVAIGLLLAPEKGSEMRKRIKKTAGGWVDGLGHIFERGQELAEDGKDKVRHAKSAAEDKVNRIKESLT